MLWSMPHVRGGGGGQGIHFYMLSNAEAAVPGDDPGDDPNSDSEDDPDGGPGDVDDPESVAHAAMHSSSLVNRFSLPLQPRNNEKNLIQMTAAEKSAN